MITLIALTRLEETKCLLVLGTDGDEVKNIPPFGQDDGTQGGEEWQVF